MRELKKTMKPRTDKFDIVHFQEYVGTYTERYPDQQNIMFLDMLYGVGICVDPEKFKGADGFDRFIEWVGNASDIQDPEDNHDEAWLQNRNHG